MIPFPYERPTVHHSGKNLYILRIGAPGEIYTNVLYALVRESFLEL